MQIDALERGGRSETDYLKYLSQILSGIAEDLSRLDGFPAASAAASLTDDELSSFAEKLYKARRARAKCLEPGLFGEAAWDMLLDLFISHNHGGPVPVTSLCIAGAVPPTTGLRWIQVLEQFELVTSFPTAEDRRVRLIALTCKGHDAMRNCLAELHELLEKRDLGAARCR